MFTLSGTFGTQPKPANSAGMFGVSGATGYTQPIAQFAQPQTGGFETVGTAKSPGVQGVINNFLSELTGMRYGDNSLNVRTAPRSQAVQTATAGQFNQMGQDQQANQQSFRDFVTNLVSTDPQARANMQQETQALGRVYDQGPNGFQAVLDRINRERASGVNMATQRALNRLGRDVKGQSMTGGDSSYLKRLALDSGRDLYANQAATNADQERANLMYMLEQQDRLAGRRSELTDKYLARSLAPIETRQQMGAADTARLANVSEIDMNNQLVDVETPEQSLARRLGILGGISDVDLSNMFYGLRKPYEPTL